MMLEEVMDEIAGRVRTITSLAGRTFAYPPGEVQPPAAIVSYPDAIDFDLTYGRGVDTIVDLPVVVVVGRPTDRGTRDRITRYVAGSGDDSIKAALEAAGPVSWDDGQVTAVKFEVVSIGGIDYLAATFTMTLAGPGTT